MLDYVVAGLEDLPIAALAAVCPPLGGGGGGDRCGAYHSAGLQQHDRRYAHRHGHKPDEAKLLPVHVLGRQGLVHAMDIVVYGCHNRHCVIWEVGLLVKVLQNFIVHFLAVCDIVPGETLDALQLPLVGHAHATSLLCGLIDIGLVRLLKDEGWLAVVDVGTDYTLPLVAEHQVRLHQGGHSRAADKERAGRTKRIHPGRLIRIRGGDVVSEQWAVIIGGACGSCGCSVIASVDCLFLGRRGGVHRGHPWSGEAGLITGD